jgi:hypothetical protein
MRALAVIRVLALGAALAICLPAAARSPEPAPTVRFAALDIYLDCRTPVAAWQFELGERHGLMMVVGVENGESAAFERAPYYDREAVEHGRADRVIVADFSLQPAEKLPVGRTRIATIHVQLVGDQAPDYQLRLLAAGDSAGRPIDAEISLLIQTGRSG